MVVQAEVALAVATAAVLGFRHGIDYDHVAAISDLSNVASSRHESMKLSMLYALGHASMVTALGVLAIAIGLRLPQGSDAFMERIVGMTILVFGLYIFHALATKPGGAVIQARATIIAGALRKLQCFVLSKLSGRKHDTPPDLQGSKTALLLGAIHGIGAETPSQIVLFVLVGGLGGSAAGILAVIAFILGLLAMNAILAGIFTHVSHASRVGHATYRFAAALTGAYSMTIGIAFLLGLANSLPALM